mgnify:CR=1 FL=1
MMVYCDFKNRTKSKGAVKNKDCNICDKNFEKKENFELTASAKLLRSCGFDN